MQSSQKRKGSGVEALHTFSKRGRWETSLGVPPSEDSPTLPSTLPLISSAQNAHINGGTFTSAGRDSFIATTINYGPVIQKDNMVIPNDILKLLNSLPLPNFRRIQQATHAKVTSGTCIWLIGSGIFKVWIQRGKILWGIGIRGLPYRCDLTARDETDSQNCSWCWQDHSSVRGVINA